jgi:hypothetical protein
MILENGTHLITITRQDSSCFWWQGTIQEKRTGRIALFDGYVRPDRVLSKSDRYFRIAIQSGNIAQGGAK